MAVNKQNRWNEFLTRAFRIFDIRWPSKKVPLIPDWVGAAVQSGWRLVQQNVKRRQGNPALILPSKAGFLVFRLLLESTPGK